MRIPLSVQKKSCRRDYIKYLIFCRNKMYLKSYHRWHILLQCGIVSIMESAAKIKIWTHSCKKTRSRTVGPKFPRLWSSLKSYPRSYSKYRKSAFDTTDKYSWIFLTFAWPWCWAMERRLCNILNSHQYLWNSQLIKSEYKESHFLAMNQLQVQYSIFFSLN